MATALSGLGRRRFISVAVYVVLLLAAAVAVLLGSSMLLLAAIVCVPAYVLLRRRLSLSASLALLFVLFSWVTLCLFILAKAAGLPLLPTVVVAAAITGGAAAFLLLRPASAGAARSDFVELGVAGSGGIVWVAVLLLAALLPAGTPLSWAMSGDAANNVLFARAVLEGGGVSLSGSLNPVPLTSVLIALFTLPAAFQTSPGVGQEIIALAEMWSFGIVSASVLAGALALAVVASRRALALLAVALTSLVPLGWLTLSGAVLLGFVNFHLTIAVILASLIAIVEARRHPLAAMVVASLSVAITLALWAPLAGIPAAGVIYVMASRWREIVAAGAAGIVVGALAVLQPVWFFAVLSLPSLLSQGDALQGALGAVFDFPRSLGVVLVVVAAVFAVVWKRLTRDGALLWVTAAVVGGGGLALAALLWIRRGEADIWGYYQLKLYWFLLAILAIVVILGGLAASTALTSRPALAALAGIVAGATVWGVTMIGQSSVPTFNRDAQALQSPLARIIVGDFFSVGEGDRVFDRVVEVTSMPESTILWESSDPDEDSIMFWVVQMAAETVDDVDLRAFAYYHDGQSMDDLCTLRTLMGPPATVITADPDIARRAVAACGDLGPVILE